MNTVRITPIATPRACPECLRRARLLAQLAPYIERVVGPGSGSPTLLRLSNEALAAAVAPRDGTRILDAVEAVPERSLRAGLAAAECWGCCRHDPLYPSGLG